MTNNLQTIGELARKTGETIRTLRYYDEIGLLKPTQYKDGGHRLYGDAALHRLQEIQSLKFIGFSLKDIADILKQQYTPKNQLHEAITIKKEKLIQQMNDIERTIQQLDHMTSIMGEEDVIDIRVFCFIIHSFVWEHEHNQEYLLKHKYTIPAVERRRLDQQYYQLFTALKKLAADGASPSDSRCLGIMEDILLLHKKLIAALDEETWQALKQEAGSSNILSPLAAQEWNFFENVYIEYRKCLTNV
ncbi:transcriptional regulator, MerR family [Alteribacillus persepolensis]|uniref:Transcriptional regulator, MerR family n=1 Tax=Alteribacillus persepolensis TaxID=568899 RepID=A0A1G8EVR1_9BACI|nr:MerR family transcriptional regulator [Alteribacillus persepolensis]SDH73935.1 transcriptional regulator, MerR family [Alteribacillus persepolensis]